MIEDFVASVNSAGQLPGTEQDLQTFERITWRCDAKVFRDDHRVRVSRDIAARGHAGVAPGELRVRRDRQQIGSSTSTEKVARCVWCCGQAASGVGAANMDPDLREDEAVNTIIRYAADIAAYYKKLRRKHEERRCPICAQFKPKGAERRKRSGEDR